MEDLEEKYPYLRDAVIASKTFANSLNATIHTSTGSDARALDLATVMKASLAISSEIFLDKLLASLMKISIENAGAQSGFLILLSEGKLLIYARASVTGGLANKSGRTPIEDVIVQQSTPLEESQDLPVSVINYVERTRSDVVLSNAAAEGRFAADPYIVKQQLKSLCVRRLLIKANSSGFSIWKII